MMVSECAVFVNWYERSRLQEKFHPTLDPQDHQDNHE